MKVVFSNPGLIDLIGVKTFGVNAKVNENPIGYFGTGLKYAIAVILRSGGKINLYRGKQLYTFGTKNIESRGKSFPVVTMNGEDLGFTTDLGKNWEMWQAFRELHCNALDENGNTYATDLLTAPGDDETRFVVEHNEMHKAYLSRGMYFLETNPMIFGTELSIHQGQSTKLYYRGIAVHDLEKPSRFTYNFLTDTALTEDRTLRYAFWELRKIGRFVLTCENKGFIREWLLARDGTMESKINLKDVDFNSTPSKEFMEVVTALIKEKRINDMNPSASKFFFEEELMKMMPEDATLNPQERETLNKCIQFCKALGYQVDEFPIVVVDTLGTDVYGQAKHNKIYLARRAFQIGTKCVAGTLFEEWLHLRHNYDDCTRSMQNFLVDAIMSAGEQALKVTL